MATLGIVGSGSIGSEVARLAVAADMPIVIANSRGPESLAAFVGELGSLARAGTFEEVVGAGDLVVLSVPLTAAVELPPEVFQGKVVLDTSNYYPSRDGRISELDDEDVTTSEFVQRHLSGALLVKAFNNILAHHIPQLARPSDSPNRSALPIAGDDKGAKAQAAELIGKLGFDTVDAGSLGDSWRFEPETTAYTRVYVADPSTPDDKLLESAGGPASAEVLRSALDSSERVRVADRTF